MIPGRGEAQFDGAAIEAFVKGLGIEIAGAFIEQAGDHVADAGLVGRVLRGAAAEGIFHRDQGNGGVLHEPGLDAAGRNQALDFCRSLRRRRRSDSSAAPAMADASAARRVER